MSRPKKAVVDYFPHDVHPPRAVAILENQYGHAGYVLYYKINEILGATEGHYYNCSDEGDWQYLVSILGIKEPKATEIITRLAALSVIDPELWQEHKIIWSQPFVDDLADVYSRRKTSKPEKPIIVDGKPIQQASCTQIENKNPIDQDNGSHSDNNNPAEWDNCLHNGNTNPTESRVKESKGEESKKEEGEEPDKIPSPISDSLPLPPIEAIRGLPDADVNDALETVAIRLAMDGIFPTVKRYTERKTKDGAHPKSILHALIRCLDNGPSKKQGGASAYCNKIINVESGNYFAHDHERQHEQRKKLKR